MTGYVMWLLLGKKLRTSTMISNIDFQLFANNQVPTNSEWGAYKRKFRVKKCLGAGNCFFLAFLDQLQLLNRDNGHTHQSLRNLCVENVRDTFANISVIQGNAMLRQVHVSNIDEYCERLAQDGTYVEVADVVTMARIFNVQINLYTVNNGRTVLNENRGLPQVNLAYINNDHYDSLHPIHCECNACERI